MVVRVPIPVSDEQLHRIGDANPGWQVEVMDGVVVMSPTNSETGRRNSRLTAILVAWADANDYVAFDSSTGFTLPNRDVLCADGALVARARWNALTSDEKHTYAHLVPDVVVELLSDPAELRKTRAKCGRWIAQGAEFVLLLNPHGAVKVESFGNEPERFLRDWSAVTD